MAPITKGDTVLVTGSAGFIASHVVDQLLSAGFNVKGAVRSLERSQWSQDLFDAKYGGGRYERVVVLDFKLDGAYDEAVKGTQGIVHVASDTTLSPNPNDVIPAVLAGIRGILKAASSQPSMKRFVLTSSSSAAAFPQPGVEFSIDEHSWNEVAVAGAWAPPPYEAGFRQWHVYGASKTQGEQEMWKFAKEQKPHFEVNSVLPDSNFGPLLHSSHRMASSASFITQLYNNKDFPEFMRGFPPQYFVNVVDCARLHVAALIDADITNERIFAYTAPFNWNSILSTSRKLRADVVFPSDIEGLGEDVSTIVPRKRAEQILERHYGGGFQNLEETLRQQFECY